MTTFIRNSTGPEWLKSTSPITTKVIQTAGRVRFYLRGGGELLALKQDSQTAFEVHTPFFSNIKLDDMVKVASDLEKEVRSQIKKDKIQIGEWFLFDTCSGRILTNDSYINFIPVYAMGNSLFVIDKPDGTVEPFVRYLSDQSDYTARQMLALIVARKELMPSKLGAWSPTGKKILFFLLSHRYYYNATYTAEHGPWDAANMAFTTDTSLERDRPLTLANFNLSRAASLSMSVDSEYIDYTHQLDAPKSGVQCMTLSYALEVGIDSLFSGKYAKVIDVSVDIMADVYKAVYVDTEAGMCYVTLCNGAVVTEDKLKQDLDTDNVQIIGFSAE